MVAWGNEEHGQSTVPNDLNDAVAIAAGHSHSLALRDDNTVVAWGLNDSGQCDVPADLNGVREIAAGWDHSLALRFDGTVVAWGENDRGQTTLPAGLTNVQAIAAGALHSLALLNDGTVVAWGDNERLAIEVPADLDNVIQIGGGVNYSIALTAEGELVTWGKIYEYRRRIGPNGSAPVYIDPTCPRFVNDFVSIKSNWFSVVATRDLCPPCTPADFNRDGTVDYEDLNFQISLLGNACRDSNPDACLVDLDHDGVVGLSDLGELLNQWGICACAQADLDQNNQVDDDDTQFFFAMLGQGCSEENSDACRADFNGDGGVGLEDFSLFLNIKGACDCARADLNGDGLVDSIDMYVLFDHLGQACTNPYSQACQADLNFDGAVGVDDLAFLFTQWGSCD